MNSTTVTSDKDKANLFIVNTIGFIRNSFLLPPLDDDLKTSSPSPYEIDLLDSDVYEILISLNPEKAMGSDRIGPKILLQCALGLYKPLFQLFFWSPSEHVLPVE